MKHRQTDGDGDEEKREEKREEEKGAERELSLIHI